ncbi:MAG: GxxExxY protein, partial [Flavobacterium sp.]
MTTTEKHIEEKSKILKGLEKVYENSLMIQFRNENIKAVQQAPIKVYFKGESVGDYIADILVDDKVILELK